MKKNKLKLTLLLIFLLFGGSLMINSCQKENTTDKMAVKSEKYFVDELAACNYSEKLFSSNVFHSNMSSNMNSKPAVKKVKDINPILDKNKLTAYYIINYEDGGFILLSADKRITPILAYSTDGLMPYRSEELPEALESCLFTLKENIEIVRSGNEIASKEIKLQWEDIDNQGIGYPRLKSGNPGDPGNTCTDEFEQIGPFLSTTWGQGIGYNSLLKQQSFIPCIGVNLPDGRAYAGCTAIAMAQLMKFYQRPTSYNWSLMPNGSGSTTTATLIKAIDDALPATYTCTGTGATLSQAKNTIKSNFGYSSAILSNYDQSIIVSNLRYTRPVILSGGSGSDGHAWVCDGFQRSKICIDGVNYNSYLFLHMNWGWDGTANNIWFAFDNFNPTENNITHNYNTNRQMIYNIIP